MFTHIHNVPGILPETHETLFLRRIYKRNKLKIKKINILAYSMGLILSNKYFEAILQSLELKIFSKKIGVLFDFF